MKVQIGLALKDQLFTAAPSASDVRMNELSALSHSSKVSAVIPRRFQHLQLVEPFPARLRDPQSGFEL